jgi:hypothetical protein
LIGAAGWEDETEIRQAVKRTEASL